MPRQIYKTRYRPYWGGVLEEVLVTAQKRTQILQDVPISISVATAQDIADINAFSFTDLVQLTPGVSIFPGIQAASIRLRGVGPGFFSVGSPQSVVVFVDQFAQSQIGTVFSTLVDLERLELLRGPQGTLYGINAPGGAYNIITRSPTMEGTEGYLEGTYSQYDSSDLGAVDLRGAVNIPLVDDQLALRLAGVYRDDDGYIENVNPISPDKHQRRQRHESPACQIALAHERHHAVRYYRQLSGPHPVCFLI